MNKFERTHNEPPGTPDDGNAELSIEAGGGAAPTPPAAMLEAALSYARRGWCVFPAPPGTKRSYKSKNYSGGRNWGNTTDPEQIKRDWKRWPDACIGIATGRESGAWVFDADTKEGHDVDGFASLETLEAKHGPLPETLIVFSPTGSKHFYFQYPADREIRNSAGEIGKGLDVRGEGDMVIAPPSNRPGKGCYRWGNDAAIVAAPEWLIDLVNADHRKADAADAASTIPDPDVAFDLDLEDDAGAGLELQRDLTLREVQAALTVIDPDCDRTTWFNIGCALFSYFGAEEGLTIWDDWSKKAKKKYSGPRYMREQWKGQGWLFDQDCDAVHAC